MSMILEKENNRIKVLIPNSEATISAQIKNIKDSEVTGYYTNDKDEIKKELTDFLSQDYNYILSVKETISTMEELNKYKYEFGYIFKDSMNNVNESYNYFNNITEKFIRIPKMYFSGVDNRYFKFDNQDLIVKNLRNILYGDITGFYILRNDEIKVYVIYPFVRENIIDILNGRKTRIDALNKQTVEMNDLRKFYINNLENNELVEQRVYGQEKFIKEYPISLIRNLTLDDYCLGLDNYKNSFCYKLAYGEYKNTGFGIGSGAASKFGIYFSGNDYKYHGKNNNLIEDNQVDEYFEEFKKQLVEFIIYMGQNEFNFNINEKYPLLGGSGNYMFLTKLLCLYYPDKYIAMSKPEVYEKLNKYLNIKNQDNAIMNSYYANIEFRNIVPEANENHGFYIANAIWKFFEENEELEEGDESVSALDESKRETGAFNKIYYGVPGCGKSYTVNKEFDKDTYKIERTTFHPEYTNSDFVGQIIPKLIGSAVSYEFHPGAFAKTLLYALTHPTEKVCLIIEEINRGNASAIFGDIFQLLDRDDKGKSRYSIFNGQLIDYLKNNKVELNEIYIPSNMWIVATMNTSDQNVFTLDTAFKRRWKMEYIKNVFGLDAESQKLKNTKIPFDGKYNNITWGDFVTKINKHILLDKSGVNSEDKQLGMYFVSIEEINNKKEFAEKILSYIWEDVAKLNPEYWFGDIDSYDELLQKYDEIYLKVFDTLFEEEITIIEDTKIENAETLKGE